MVYLAVSTQYRRVTGRQMWSCHSVVRAGCTYRTAKTLFGLQQRLLSRQSQGRLLDQHICGLAQSFVFISRARIRYKCKCHFIIKSKSRKLGNPVNIRGIVPPRLEIKNDSCRLPVVFSRTLTKQADFFGVSFSPLMGTLKPQSNGPL